jgi:sugar phosphate isomerase/epimerase
MSYDRRKFLTTTTKAGGALAILAVTNKLWGCSPATKMNGELKNFGLQLYTLRDDLPKDPVGVLRQIASFGYKQIESFEGQKGMFWGMTNLEFKKLMDELDMKIISSHTNIDENFQKKADEAAAIGMKYLIAPYLGPQKTLDDYKRAAEKFNQRGEVCKKAGIKFAYHNHDYSFTKMDGVFPQDIFMQNTDKDLVKFEMDIYWVVTAGQDPIAWFKKYPERFTLCHVKDRMKNASEKAASTDLGKGAIDWATILTAAKKEGMDYFIVEQERYDGTTPLKAVQVDAEYMKQLKLG